MEDKGLVCRDDADSSARTGSDNDIPCLGRMDRGTVLEGGNLFGSSLLTSDNYGTAEDLSNEDTWRYPNTEWIPPVLFGPNSGFQNSRTGTQGILHRESFKFPEAKNIKLTVHTGKADQEADQTLMGIANAKDFLVQQKYFADDATKYWTANHRLLDSAYVVTRDEITAEDGRSPDLSFVVRGKFVNCHNYDGSYRISQGNHTDLALGDSVTIVLANGSTSGGTADVIDKWYFVDANGLTEHRIRFGNFRDGNEPSGSGAVGEAAIITNGNVGKFTVTKVGTSTSLTFISPEYSNDPSAPVAPTDAHFVGALVVNFSGKEVPLTRVLETATYEELVYHEDPRTGEVDTSIVEVTRITYKYTLDFSNPNNDTNRLSSDQQTKLKIASEVNAQIKLTLTANSNTKTMVLAGQHLDTSTMVYSISGIMSELEALFGNPDRTTGTRTATGTSASLVSRRLITQDSGDSLDPTDAEGLTIQITQEDVAFENASVVMPTTSSLKTFCDNNSILPLSKDLPNRFTIGSAKYKYGIVGSHLDVQQFGDLRVSINPAMQLLDYLTSTRYGKGLDVNNDLDLNSFREVARSCDTSSDVIILFPNSESNLSVGQTYRYPANTTDPLLWRGKLTSITSVTYTDDSGTSTTYKQALFEECIGKLGRKWNSWYSFADNEIVWTSGGRVENLICCRHYSGSYNRGGNYFKFASSR